MRYVSLISAIIFSLALTGCGEEEAAKANKKAVDASRTEITLKLAHSSEEAGDFAAAERYYKQAVSKATEPDPHLELADFYRRHHGDKLALDVLQNAVSMYPRNTDILRGIANAYINLNKAEQAVSTIDSALALTSNDPLLYNAKGIALDMLGKYTQARNAYSTAIDLDPENAATYKANLAMSYISTEYYSKAISLLLPIATAQDSTAQIRQNLALAYGLKGDNENALKWASKDLTPQQAQENVAFYNKMAQKTGDKTLSPPPNPVSSTVTSIPPIP